MSISGHALRARGRGPASVVGGFKELEGKGQLELFGADKSLFLRVTECIRRSSAAAN